MSDSYDMDGKRKQKKFSPNYNTGVIQSNRTRALLKLKADNPGWDHAMAQSHYDKTQNSIIRASANKKHK